MQPAAEIPGDCTPGHSVFSASAATCTPLPWRFMTFLSTLAVYHSAAGRTVPLPPDATAVAAPVSPTTHAHTNATLNPLRILNLLPSCRDACGFPAPARAAANDRRRGLADDGSEASISSGSADASASMGAGRSGVMPG